MPEQSIQSDDMALKRVFQDFYRVPDYQREYVWGEADPKGQKGDEVEQFLRDIYGEFENATAHTAPEYFIGTIVVCPSSDDVYDLIDGQQRITTAFLTLCAIRDLLVANCEQLPNDLPPQIFASSTTWQATPSIECDSSSITMTAVACSAITPTVIGQTLQAKVLDRSRTYREHTTQFANS
jgi:hypothetical protein